MSHDKEPIMDGDGFGEYSSVLKESAKTPNKFQYCTEFDNKENSYTANIADDTFNMASSDKTFDAFDDSCSNMKLRWSCTPGSSPAVNRSAYDSCDRSMNNSLTENNNSTCTALDFENGNVILSSHNYSSDVLGMDTSLDNSRITIVEHTSSTNVSLDSCKNNTLLQDRSIESSKVPNISIKSAEEFKQDTTSPLSINIGSDNESNSKDYQGASSPILRGIKNVINMFRPSQSPIPPSGTSPDCARNSDISTEKPSPVANRSSEKIAVTPDKKVQRKNSVTNRTFEGETKKQDSSDFVTVFKEDFINDIQWTDDSTIIFNTKKSKGNRSLHDGESNSLLSSSRLSTDSQSMRSRGSSLSKVSLNEIYDNTDTTSLTNDISLKSPNNQPAKSIPEELQIETGESIRNDSDNDSNSIGHSISAATVDRNSETINVDMLTENVLFENSSNQESHGNMAQIMAEKALNKNAHTETFLHYENNVQGNVSINFTESATNVNMLDRSNLSQSSSPLERTIDMTTPNDHIYKDEQAMQNVLEGKKESQTYECIPNSMSAQENVQTMSENNLKSSEVTIIEKKEVNQKGLIQDENDSLVEEFEDCLDQLYEAKGFELSFETVSPPISEALPIDCAVKCNDILLQTIVQDPQMPVVIQHLDNSNVCTIDIRQNTVDKMLNSDHMDSRRKLLQTISCNSQDTEERNENGYLSFPHNGLEKNQILIDQITDSSNMDNSSHNIAQNEELNSGIKVGEATENSTDVGSFSEITLKDTHAGADTERLTEKVAMNLNASHVLKTDYSADHTGNRAVNNLNAQYHNAEYCINPVEQKTKVSEINEPEISCSELSNEQSNNTLPVVTNTNLPEDTSCAKPNDIVLSSSKELDLTIDLNEKPENKRLMSNAQLQTISCNSQDTEERNENGYLSFPHNGLEKNQILIDQITDSSNMDNGSHNIAQNEELNSGIKVGEATENNTDVGSFSEITLKDTHAGADTERLTEKVVMNLNASHVLETDYSADHTGNTAVNNLNAQYHNAEYCINPVEQKTKVSEINEPEISCSELSNEQSNNTLPVVTNTNLPEDTSCAKPNDIVLSSSKELDLTIDLNEKPENKTPNVNMSVQGDPNISYLTQKSVDDNIKYALPDAGNSEYDSVSTIDPFKTNTKIRLSPEPEEHQINSQLNELETRLRSLTIKTVSEKKMDLCEDKMDIDEEIPDTPVNNIAEENSYTANIADDTFNMASSDKTLLVLPDQHHEVPIDITTDVSTDCQDATSFSQNATTLTVSLDTVKSDLTGEIQYNKIHTSDIQECDEPVVFKPIKASTSNDLNSEMNFDACSLMKTNNKVIDEAEDLEIEEILQSKYLNPEEIENPFTTKTKIRMSPNIEEKLSECKDVSFDAIENPFATRSKVTMSPTSEQATPLAQVTDKSIKNGDMTQIIISTEEKKPANQEKSVVDQVRANSSSSHSENLDVITVGTRKSTPIKQKRPEIRKSRGSKVLSGNKLVTPVLNLNNEDKLDFETIENPFATRTTIRMSPTFDGVQNECIEEPQNTTRVLNQITTQLDNMYLSKMEYAEKHTSEETENITKAVDSPSKINIQLKMSPTNQKYVAEENLEIHKEDNPFITRSKVRLSPSLENQQIQNIMTEPKCITPSQKMADDNDVKTISNALNETVSLNKMNETRTINSNDPSNSFAMKSNFRASPPLDITIASSVDVTMNSTIENGEITYIKKSDSVLEISQIININDTKNMEVSKSEDKNECSLNLTGDQICDKNTIQQSVNSNKTIQDTVRPNENPKPAFGYIQKLVNQVSNIISPSHKVPTGLNSSVQNDQKQLSSVDVTMKQDEHDDEDFAPAEMFFKDDAIEYLMNKTTTTTDRGKDSLFIKFDPLYVTNGKSNVERIDAALPSGNVPAKNRLSGSFHEKPVLAVSPAVNSDQIKPSVQTPPRQENNAPRFVSPAIAAIDKLISLGGSPSRGSPPRLVDIRDTSSANYFQQQMEAAKRLLSEREEEYKKKVSDLEKSNAEHAGNVRALEAKLLEQSKQNARMIKLNQEYEHTILSLLSKRDDDKKKHKEENSKLVRERDEQTAHLSSMEHSFNDLHAKYEKSKTMIFSFKSNEESLKKRIADSEASCKKLEEVYEQIKKHATTKLNEANQTLETMKKAHQVETVKLNAMIKKKELDISSLQETLTQKIKDNEALESICDELLIKVG